MDAKRKAAYRGIIYNFLIQIKEMGIPSDTSAIVIGRYAGPAAHALHNLALASVNDFVGFDEQAFWRMMDAWDVRFPNMGFSGFRTTFDYDLANG